MGVRKTITLTGWERDKLIQSPADQQGTYSPTASRCDCSDRLNRLRVRNPQGMTSPGAHPPFHLCTDPLKVSFFHFQHLKIMKQPRFKKKKGSLEIYLLSGCYWKFRKVHNFIRTQKTIQDWEGKRFSYSFTDKDLCFEAVSLRVKEVENARVW